MNKLDTTKTVWDLSEFYKNPDDPQIQEDMAYLKTRVESFSNDWITNTQYLSDPQVLKTALDEYESLLESLSSKGKFGLYGFLKKSQNESDTKIITFNNKIDDFMVNLLNSMQFFEIRLSKVDDSYQKVFLESDLIKEYRQFLKNLFNQARYILTESEEKILTLKAKVSSENWVNMASEFLNKSTQMVFTESNKKENLSFSQILSLLSNKNKHIRISAYKAFCSIYKRNIDVVEKEINSFLENKKIDDELRGYTRPDEARHIRDDIPSEFVDTLIKTVSQRFDIPQRFYLFKSKILGLKSMKYYERNIEVDFVNKKYTYDESVEMLHNCLAKIDPDFKRIFAFYVESGKFDVFPRKNKTGGGFCIGDYHHNSDYILMNFTGILDDVFTIAHETGHGINHELQRNTCNSLDFGSTLPIAEVASTLCEEFLFECLFENTDKEQQLSLLMNSLSDAMHSIFGQTAFYNFELELHKDFREKAYLDKDQIGSLFEKHMISFLGKIGLNYNKSWISVPHFRESFYVCSYVSGSLISKSLYAIYKENPNFIKEIKKFLSAGRSDSTQNLFRSIGIDIADSTFWTKGLNLIETQLRFAQDLAKSLGRI